jgi:hypothetical protein
MISGLEVNVHNDANEKRGGTVVPPLAAGCFMILKKAFGRRYQK